MRDANWISFGIYEDSFELTHPVGTAFHSQSDVARGDVATRRAASGHTEAGSKDRGEEDEGGEDFHHDYKTK